MKPNLLHVSCVSLVLVACNPVDEPPSSYGLFPTTTGCAADQVEVGESCLPAQAPASWTCADNYNASDGCHCDCGAVDPDCLANPSAPVLGCSAVGATCSAQGACKGGEQREWTCDSSYYGTADGCDCGCGLPDPDCPTPLTIDACEYEYCTGEEELDPNDPTICVGPWTPNGWNCGTWQYDDGTCDCGCGAEDSDCGFGATAAACGRVNCGNEEQVVADDLTRCEPIPTPPGWTCAASWFDDGTCDCGCGILDPDCGVSVDIASCQSDNGCGGNAYPDPADPTQCLSNPTGWTCNGLRLVNDSCDCGCGIADPECPSELRFDACDDDGCDYGDGPDPVNPTQCIDNPPQDDWTCELSMLYDGATCDCGCGAIDPDCDTGLSSAACDTTACYASQEVNPDDLGECWARCEPPDYEHGTATCTNGGESSFCFGSSCACSMSLYSCTDGNRYEVECEYGDCVCSVNGACVARASGSCSLNWTCGFNLVDDR